jgi:hypothetical protein
MFGTGTKSKLSSGKYLPNDLLRNDLLRNVSRKYNRKVEKDERNENLFKDESNEDQRSGIQKERELTNELSDEQKQRDLEARREGKTYSDEVLNREYQGLTPNQRNVAQETSNAQIGRDVHGYEKKLLAQQGARGLKGGSAYAQQRDLARMGLEAQQQTSRDLSSLDADLALRKLAAAYNIEQANVGQSQYRNEQAREDVDAYNNRRYQKRLAEQANQLFSRV